MAKNKKKLKDDQIKKRVYESGDNLYGLETEISTLSDKELKDKVEAILKAHQEVVDHLNKNYLWD